MDVTIKYSAFIEACKNPLTRDGNEAVNGTLDFAARQCADIFGAETLRLFSEYKIHLYDAVFSGKNTISELARKKYGVKSHTMLTELEYCVLIAEIARGSLIFFCNISKDDSSASLIDPEQLHFTLTNVNDKRGRKLKKRIEKNNYKLLSEKKLQVFTLLARKKLISIRLRLLVDVMKGAQSDRRFIARFNEELFFKNVTVGATRLAASDVVLFFDGAGANQYLNLKQKPVQIAIIALYAIATRKLTLKDIYSVAAIFPTEEGAWRIRGKDDLKIEAANEFISTVKSADFNAIISMFAVMGRAILELELPKTDLGDSKALADNYTLYAGISNIGAAYLTAVKNQSITLRMLEKALGTDFKRAMSAARLLTSYEKIVTLCNGIALLQKDKNVDITQLDGYEEAVTLQNKIGWYTKINEIKFLD